MTNKVLTNFRDHPTMQFDDEQLVFKIEDKVYLISNERTVRQILPAHITHTNIGEPYAKLVRLYFLFADDDTVKLEYEECIDFAPEHEEALRQLITPETDAEKRIGA